MIKMALIHQYTELQKEQGIAAPIGSNIPKYGSNIPQYGSNIPQYGDNVTIKDIIYLTALTFHYLSMCIENRYLPSYFLPKQNILEYHRGVGINEREACIMFHNIMSNKS